MLRLSTMAAFAVRAPTAFVRGFCGLIQNTPADQLILETTGLASPDNVVHSLEELNDICKIGLDRLCGRCTQPTEHPEYLNEKN
ncbi:MAG: hypothetical protein ACLSE8_14390 [Parasutterella sp.]